VTGYRAALPDHARPAQTHNSQPDAPAAGPAEVPGTDAGQLLTAIPVCRAPADHDAPSPEAGQPDLAEAVWPQAHRDDVDGLIEARSRLLEAGETAQAWHLTEMACGRLHAAGDFGLEAALISDTLARLPEHSPERAGWIFALGKIAQVAADYAVAERCFRQALNLFAAVGDRAGVSGCNHSLGVLAQARGEYAEAERCYRQSAHAADGPAAPAAGPAPATRAATLAADVPSATEAATPAADAAPSAIEAATPAAPRHTTGQRPAAWRLLAGHAAQWRAPGLAGLALGLLALSATEVFATLTSANAADPAPPPAAAYGPSGTAGLQAAAWVAGQISHSAVVSCDPAMCSELETRGVPAGDLLMLGPGGPRAASPLGSDVIVATGAIRREFGSRLAEVYAPVVLAAFGSGRARVEIRAVAPDGTAAYQDAMAADLAARLQAGAQLLRNPDISASPAARGPLSDGSVDSRLLVTLAVLAGLRPAHPIRIISFGAPAPGASPGVPLRSAEITGPASQAIVAFLRAQQAPYLAAVIRTIRLPGGQAAVAVRIGFASPSPLGLLGSASPTAQATPPA
jgi:tetratricopeptide (TPR) repeat protein